MNRNYIDRIQELNKAEFVELLSTYTEEDRLYAELRARELMDERFGRKIYVRGLIEFTNICRNDCYYCGIRAGNSSVERFRLTPDDIMSCCEYGYEIGFRTLVLQGGEDPYFDDDRMCGIVRAIRSQYPDCAITLSIGERSKNSYARLKEAGADRFLLRHETADCGHYAKLHPAVMSHSNRMECLRNLKELGYQTGCGIMVGSPYQTFEHIAEDMIFMRDFQPEMVGIGPFLPQSSTPFRDEPAGSVDLTLFLLSLIRLMLPDVMLPATTALGSATLSSQTETGDSSEDEVVTGCPVDGRIRGILAGANVCMPNLSPGENREKYLLYDNKAGLNDDAAYVLQNLREKLAPYGYEISMSRGDYGENCK